MIFKFKCKRTERTVHLVKRIFDTMGICLIIYRNNETLWDLDIDQCTTEFSTCGNDIIIAKGNEVLLQANYEKFFKAVSLMRIAAGEMPEAECRGEERADQGVIFYRKSVEPESEG